MCLRNVQCSKLNNNFLNRWMQPFQGPTIISTHQQIILAREIILISHGVKIIMTNQSQTTSNIPIIITILPIINSITITIITINLILPIINKTFLTMLHSLLSKILHLRKQWLILKRLWKYYEEPRVPYTNTAEK